MAQETIRTLCPLANLSLSALHYWLEVHVHFNVANQYNINIKQLILGVRRKNLQMTNPGELDFAEESKHCNIHHAGNLMLNFLQFPFRMHSSMSSVVIRPSWRSNRPLTSQDINSQSQTYGQKAFE